VGVKVLAFGGGVQTTALLLLRKEGRVSFDHAVFADTIAERPETYGHLARLQNAGFTYNTVVSKDGPLEDWLWHRSTCIPVLGADWRGHRQCTEKWKIRPINRYLRELGADTLLIGISADEVHRLKPPQEKWVTREWPLVDMGWTRRRCQDYLREGGYIDVPRSACWFCPLQSIGRWRSLQSQHPDLWQRAMLLEKQLNERKGARVYLTGNRLPLSHLDGQMNLDLEGEECEGFCFT